MWDFVFKQVLPSFVTPPVERDFLQIIRSREKQHTNSGTRGLALPFCHLQQGSAVLCIGFSPSPDRTTALPAAYGDMIFGGAFTQNTYFGDSVKRLG